MSTGTGVYLLATTGAEGVLFRHSTGLTYDTLAVQYTSLVYLVVCGSGLAPAWHPSPCPLVAWNDVLAKSSVLRSASWIPITPEHRPIVARFVGTVCLSTPQTWSGWAPALLGGLLDMPSTPVRIPPASTSPWERMVLPAPSPSPRSPAGIADTVVGWTRAMDRGVPPVIDLNALLVLLDQPVRPGTSSVAATLLVLPPDAPRVVLLPETDAVLPLWHPNLDAYSYDDVERLNTFLHSAQYLSNEFYDELRDVCQKKLSSLTKRWLTHS